MSRPTTCVNLNGVSLNLICALIFWRSGLGMLIGNFRYFLTELSAHDLIMQVIIVAHLTLADPLRFCATKILLK